MDDLGESKFTYFPEWEDQFEELSSAYPSFGQTFVLRFYHLHITAIGCINPVNALQPHRECWSSDSPHWKAAAYHHVRPSKLAGEKSRKRVALRSGPGRIEFPRLTDYPASPNYRKHRGLRPSRDAWKSCCALQRALQAQAALLSFEAYTPGRVRTRFRPQ